MKRLLYLAVVLILIGAAYWAGSRRGQQNAATHASRDPRKVLYYVDPMNPAHTSDKPGLAPCGMKMEPVYADGPAVMPSAKAAMSKPGVVKLTPEKQQLIGLRLSAVEAKPVTHTLRLLGRVSIDETRAYRINATIDGWITRALPLSVGCTVTQCQTLATFYSPEFLGAAQAMVFALGSKDRVHVTGNETDGQQAQLASFDLSIRQYRDGLRNLGVGELQLQELIRTRKPLENIDITSPANGFIVARNVSDGQRFEKGTELFRIADLSHVWVLVDVFERDARLVQPSQAVTVRLSNQDKMFPATVSATLPQFDNVSRTLKLRLEADNPDVALKPDMFVDVELPVTLPETLVVPADAVLDGGLQQTVFVAMDDGVFEPRPVRTGWRHGDQVQILDGLEPGEKIAISGTFLLDSESRMKLAAATQHQAVPGAAVARDPVCGMSVDERDAMASHRLSHYQGKTYYFCADTCQRAFEREPARYVQKHGTELSEPEHALRGPMTANR